MSGLDILPGGKVRANTARTTSPATDVAERLTSYSQTPTGIGSPA